ncbi:LysE family translocator [Microbulbifer sp. 2304DJ12-6]|uniref:LysE family translocator n=1 Tax=Microbulbifer sp. 2304DJ12-6 TaxID=3233340 RepID=UPI0039AEAA21
MEFVSAVFMFAFSTTITPGPNNVMIMASGMNYGTKKSFPHFLGICIGFPLMVICIGLGLGILFKKFPLMHEGIKILGVAYLLYLAWLVARSKPSELQGASTKPLTFFQAALFQWLNPKAWMMATGTVAAYTVVSLDIYAQVLLISLVFFIAAFPCVGIWLFFGVYLKKILKKQSYQRAFNISMALLLVISVIPVIVE